MKVRILTGSARGACRNAFVTCKLENYEPPD